MNLWSFFFLGYSFFTAPFLIAVELPRPSKVVTDRVYSSSLTFSLPLQDPLRARLRQPAGCHKASYQTQPLLYTLRAQLQQPVGCHKTSYQTRPLLYTLRAQLQQPLGCHRTSYQTQPLLHSLRAQLQQPHGWHKLLTKLRSYCGLSIWLHLHPYRENFFLDGPFVTNSACTIHPFRKIFFLDGTNANILTPCLLTLDKVPGYYSSIRLSQS